LDWLLLKGGVVVAWLVDDVVRCVLDF